jgi:peptidoglycan/LPS O-acetylase OafA/YrhL
MTGKVFNPARLKHGIAMTSSRPSFLQPATQPFGKDITSLTSLRFFAAFMVVLLHFRLALPIDVDAYTPIFSKGYLAVDFFFVLSGFIIAHVYLSSVESGTFNASGFILKRFARLYPVHLFTMVAYVGLMIAYQSFGLTPKEPERYDIAAIPANVLMVHAWGFMSKLTFNSPSWSISAEWFAYLLFVPLAHAIVRSRVRPVALLITAGAAYGAAAWVAEALLGQELMRLHWNFGIVRIVPEFLIGVAAYRIGSAYDCDRRSVRIGVCLIALCIVAVAHFDLSAYLMVPLFALLILGVAVRARAGDRGLLDNRIFVYLGEISYSTYMVHALCYTLFFNGLELLLGHEGYLALVPLLWVASFGVVIGASALSYHFVEVPGRRLIAALGASHRRRTPIKASARTAT